MKAFVITVKRGKDVEPFADGPKLYLGPERNLDNAAMWISWHYDRAHRAILDRFMKGYMVALYYKASGLALPI